jgi:hypothetical protein
MTTHESRMNELKSQSQSYVTTDGQSASLSWNKAPIWGLRPDLYYCWTVAGLLMWGALSVERTGLPFTIASGPPQCSHSWVRVPRYSWPYFTVSDSRPPFSSPPTTRRATVEVFDPSSTRAITLLKVKVKVMLRPTVQSASWSWNKVPIRGLRPDLYYCQTVAGLLMWVALSDERTGLSFTVAVGPRQCNHSWVWFPCDSRPYFTVSDSRPPFSSPPTTRGATVEIFDPASTQDITSPSDLCV